MITTSDYPLLCFYHYLAYLFNRCVASRQQDTDLSEAKMGALGIGTHGSTSGGWCRNFSIRKRRAVHERLHNQIPTRYDERCNGQRDYSADAEQIRDANIVSYQIKTGTVVYTLHASDFVG